MQASHITVYSERNNSRLQYVLDWLLKEQLKLDYTLVHNTVNIPANELCIAYGKTLPNAVSIPDSGLLWQQGIITQHIATGTWRDIPTLYATQQEGYTLPFDLLSAIFFLLTRYEEYLPYTPDKYERYPATGSILHKNGWLRRPLLDEWLHALRTLLLKQGMQLPVPVFTYQPTYDIDIAYSYLHKGWKRNLGGLVKDLLRIKPKLVQQRIYVLFGKEQDPYDCFMALRKLHMQYGYTPIYFILAAQQTTDYDKNASPHNHAMQHLIKGLAAEGYVGMHPSYFSNNEDIFKAERNILSEIIKSEVRLSRQHYIRMTLPETYRRLIRNGIMSDFSMGYGTHLGFRAGTGNSFHWYDLKEETVTPLRIYPFCFMDSTAMYEEKLTAVEAFAALRSMTEVLKTTGTPLITVMHNFSLGLAPEWQGWYDAYTAFMEGTITATTF